MQTVQIQTNDIQLDQLLKLAGILHSGAEIKELLAKNMILLNNETVTQRRKKIKIGDIVKIGDETTLTVTKKG